MAKDGETVVRDSTSKLPMIDLRKAIEAVAVIRDKAVEIAPMPKIAEALGYKAATSTPFYRLVTAARLFNLLSQRAALTQDAIDYIKPHAEGMQAKVLKKAILSIPTYSDLVSTYRGMKLNVELVKNSIAKTEHLSDSCAMICAKAFESSLQFAGMLAADGAVLTEPEASGDAAEQPDPANAFSKREERQDPPPPPPPPDPDVQEQTLYLDKTKTRCCTVKAPLNVTRVEFDRICKWLEFAILIDDPQQTGTT